jgi:stearoyl-CoA desaturase (delta-9 desaturase)
MAFIDRVLQRPSYGWEKENGELMVPTRKQLFREAFNRINVFKTRKNWLALLGWFMIICMVPFLYFFVTRYFSWPLLIAVIVYSMIIMGTHGTIWFHRYCTHKAYKFSHPIWRFFTQHLVVKTIPEEMYVVSHHVHHARSDKPGDPYNSRGGLLYCVLADVNHQSISKDLSESDYYKVARFMRHTGVPINSFKQYMKWGSLANPAYTICTWILNWGFWYAILYLIGGNGLACAIFSAAMFWFIFVRVFNYTGHAKGKVKHVDGVDFDRSNLSINQTRTGLFTGEWHNNHHLYPDSARAGFLPYQLDLAWMYIYLMHLIGVVSSYKDSKQEFREKYLQVRREEQDSNDSHR